MYLQNHLLDKFTRIGLLCGISPINIKQMIREKMSKILWDTKIAERTALAQKALKLDWNRDADS